jgi:hypothetical protein
MLSKEHLAKWISAPQTIFAPRNANAVKRMERRICLNKAGGWFLPSRSRA